MNDGVARTVACLSALLLPGVVHAEPPPKPPKVNDPALRVELVATVPDVEACTTVCSDPHGAIYVGNDPRDGRLNTKEPVCTIVRFSGVPMQGGGARKRTVFAENLYSPAGSAWHDGWLYVIHDPLMSRFKDTNGDGIADVREDLITNLGHAPYEGLNDHCVSGLTLGMDGFFYLSVGDRGIYQAKSARDGSTITMQGGGIVRCRPDGTELEIFSTGTRNHLSVNLDAEDNAFTRDNTDDGNGWWTRLTHHIEGGYYGYPYDYRSVPNYGVTQPSKETLSAIRQHGIAGSANGGVMEPRSSEGAKGQQPSSLSDPSLPLRSFAVPSEIFLPAITDFGGGSPTGGLCYLSDGLPEKYRGKHFFSEWGKAGLFVTELARDGATFKVVSDTKLVEADKGGEFRPMQIAVAHDGSLLIADWGYGGWKSPRVAGAVWRLYWPEAKPAPRLEDETKATFDALIGALRHVDRDQRLRAQWALAAKGQEVVASVGALLAGKTGSEVIGNRAASSGAVTARALEKMHAVWTLEQIMGPLCRDFPSHYTAEKARLINSIQTILNDAGIRGDDAIRAQAMRALAYRRTWFDCEVVGNLAEELHNSSDPAVRLQAVLAMGRMGFLNLPPLVVKLLADPDRAVRFAARHSLQRFISRYGLAIGDLDAKVFARPALDDHQWAIFGRLRLGEPIQLSPGRWLNDPWSNQEEILIFLADRLEGKFQATSADRARAAAALGGFAYLSKPYDGHWWATQPVKNPPPLKSAAWAGTPKALGAVTSALSDRDTGVRLAAAQAFSRFLLGTRDANGVEQNAPDLALAVANARAMLRTRLTAETDAAVRRQLIESLGVQRDPEAVSAFVQIALDEKADPAFRQTAIAALVKVGDDRAKKAIAQLAVAALCPAATEQVLAAIGALKVTEAAPALLRHIRGGDENLASAAAKALGALGPKSWPPETESALLATLDGGPHAIQKAAIELLAAAKAKAVVPRLVAMAEANPLRKEALTALAAMPDAQSLPVLVAALADKDGGTRRTVLKALKSLREQALPLIEQKIASGAIPPELASEIRAAFETGVIIQWKMIGPFENVWGAVHPVESDMLSKNGDEAADRVERARGVLARRYLTVEGKEAGWIDVAADPETGRINLEKLFKTNAMVCAYAFAEIHSAEPAEAKLFCGSDDQIAVWLNGAKVHEASGSRGFEPDKDEAPLRLVAGANQLLVKIGNNGGAWEFAMRLPGLDGTTFRPGKVASPEEKQRAFALARKPDGSWVHPGNARRGEKLFHDPNAALKGICATCHAVGAFGGQIGPNLSMIGAVYPRADLITSILEPSKTNALGFEQVMIETRDGQTLVGAVRQESADELTLTGADGKPHVLKKSAVKARELLPISMMPPGLTVGLQPAEFADLLAYLESLRGE